MNQKAGLEEIRNIRNLMEKSTRYMTLSGFASIMAGIYAIVGAIVGYVFVYNQNIKWDSEYSSIETTYPIDPRMMILIIAGSVLFLAVSTAYVLTRRKAIKKDEIFWNKQAKQVVYQFIIPLITGGVFCLLLLWQNNIELVASACLIFYGLALLNASKYTFSETHQFAIFQIVLGLIAGFFLDYGIVFWTIGFGVFHIIFGIIIYLKYERNYL